MVGRVRVVVGWTFSAHITMTFDDGGTTTVDVPLTTLDGDNPNAATGTLPI
jgi:hypothetical protein